MLTNKIITCLILAISLNAGAYMGKPKTYYNNAQIGKSYKSQLQQASVWKSRLTSMETNILARSRIDMVTKKRIEDAKSQLSIFEESFKQLKNSGDYELGSMILKETAYSSDCKPKSISAPIPSVTVYECNSPTRMRETFFSKVKDGDYHVTSYKSGYLEDTLKDVELLIHELRRYDARAINVGRIVHRV